MSGWANSRTRHLRLSGRALQQRNRRILRRDASICHLCGLPGADVVDHVISLAQGGLESDANLRAAHAACNARKAVTTDRPRRAPRRRPTEPHPGAVPR